MANLVKPLLRDVLLRNGYCIRRTDDLTALADKFGSDKGNTAYAHAYARIYNRLFSELRDREVVFVEIGLQRADIDKRRSTNGAEGASTAVAHDAPSLRMWRSYFEKASIYGFDIDDFSAVHIDGCEIVRGDMSSSSDLLRLANTVGRPIDILIDDGSHASHHQQIALGALFERISPGGMYIIEDLHWQDPSVEKTGAPKTRDILRRFLVDGTVGSPYLTAAQNQYLEKNIKSLSLHDSMTLSVDDPTDAVAVLVKT